MTWLAVQRSTFDNVEAERWNDGDNMDYMETGQVKQSFDSIAESSPPGDFSKRRFDKIGSYNSLGGLQKRVFDRIGGASSLGGLSKKSSSDQFEERVQRAFDRIGGMSSFSGLNKKTAD